MGWSRKGIKADAKSFLKIHYWKTFLAVLFTVFITLPIELIYNTAEIFLDTDLFIEFFSIYFIVLISTRILLLNVLEVGLANYFIEADKGNVSVSNILFGFKSSCYLNIVKIMLLRDVYLFLWSLLFIIPGIVKSYEYKFIPYLLAENPKLLSDVVFIMTKKMTYNEKWKMFVLDLSFIGWYLLGSLIIIGSIFVTPYYYTTYAKLYLKIRENQKISLV